MTNAFEHIQDRMRETFGAAADEIEAAIAARAGERFDHTAASGSCVATVDLRRRLVDFQFLRANATREHDRESLAAEATEAIAGAQAKAREAADRIAAEIYERIDFQPY